MACYLLKKCCMDHRHYRIHLVICAGLLACVNLYPSFVMAAQSVSRVNVTVASIDNLSVSDAAQGILLRLDGSPGSHVLMGESDQTARLSYSHNAALSKKVTAQVSPADLPVGPQDITLAVEVMGGAEQDIVIGGVTQGAKEVLKGVPPGSHEDVPVRYSASATASGSRPGEYNFRVTFTSLDDD